ncbi:hypothetical protein EK403_12130 [Hansschlegelia zhihuaiae]|uniref:Uncharacterized protein n=1 Tax=Hansschlegelia zhihuaiae TaxID=405005 RepID=A0A4Q0MHI6_9HYPH|nr:hypothetical protein EK403_12130 [Hansschlegelia zhihuaiae]
MGGRRLGLTAAALLAAALAGCAQTGDFGRPQPNVVNDALMPATGAALAYARNEPVSSFRLTDEEREMRDLAWAIVTPPLSEQVRGRMLAELRRTRILPAARARLDPASYVRALISIDFRSSAARYARLKEDVRADTYRIEPFFAAASDVAEGDRVRARALTRVPDVTEAERADALARIEENALMIGWVRESFEERLVSYRFALDRLILETPDPYAVEVSRAIDAFAAVLGSLRPLGAPRGVFKS